MTCRFCGTALPEGAMFCGECGRATGPADVAELELAPTASARDTAVIDPTETEPESGSEPEPDLDLDLEPDAEETEAEPEVELEPDPEPERAVEAEPEVESASRPAPDPFPWGASSAVAVDLESTRVVGAPPPGKRFVLQFSTGDSVIVSGTGLVGRNPAAEPGEFFDQLVTIFDAGKSVSKTHLEFGQEGGRFWVADRFSTNGSMVRQPDLAPRRCEPGRRYFVARGSRVDIGEQFFVVS